ncbi:NAD(P)-dependent oxidoreductase [Lapidilactobacillus mulanensis]|uniref:NAD(P)-dependent oxidoreductase n=1 Tax=Lapidilactobacillus mulanensis TaxID=2485999 RepID=A0ABW4DQ04_9LACO|nr:NAD(P)-dependent oxidoreductase [Lapidilactobacillus mulanensis]
MKITAFGVNQTEKFFLEKLAGEQQFELNIVEAWASAANLDLAAGSLAISTLQTGPYDEALFAKMAALDIRLLALRNVGTDNVDFAAAKKYGIQVSHVPSYSPNTLAEFVVMNAMRLLRRTKEMDLATAAGELTAAQKMVGRQLSAQVVGVVGTGHIGFETARLLHQIGAKVVAFDPHPSEDSPEWLTYAANIEELLSQVNIVTLHVPGIKANDHLLNAQRIALLPDNAIIINTGRGNLIDTDALIAALRAGKLSGVAIDTFEYEAEIEAQIQAGQQPSEPHYLQLQQMPNVIMTPHIAYHSLGAVENMVKISIDNIFNFAKNGSPINRVE